MPDSELIGLPWSCSGQCRQSKLANDIALFVAEIEPIQKAAARKKRRLASELSSLQINSRDFDDAPSSSRRVSTRGGRSASSFDYSFREFDRAISDAIRKSERKSADAESSEEEPRQLSSRTLSREERMALRNRRFDDEKFKIEESTDVPGEVKIHDTQVGSFPTPITDSKAYFEAQETYQERQYSGNVVEEINEESSATECPQIPLQHTSMSIERDVNETAILRLDSSASETLSDRINDTNQLHENINQHFSALK
jgi:hypothetical protein